MHAFPDIPDSHAIAVLVLTIIAFYLFSRERVSLETTGLIVLAGSTPFPRTVELRVTPYVSSPPVFADSVGNGIARWCRRHKPGPRL
jgi:hypothetical protein